jgi:hypothetical protein
MKYHQPYGVTDPNASYINGDPSVGRMGSIPPAESIEMDQREIVNLIADANLATPDDGDLHQLSKAVQSTLLMSDDDAGTVNQFQVTMTPAPTAYFKYMQVICKIAHDNSGPSTLNCNALGPQHIVHVDGSDLGSAELKANSITCFEYDGINFQIAWSTGTRIGGSGANPGAPIYLTAPADYYVNNTTGSDTLYDGTTAAVVASTTHGPFKTIQKACDQVPKYNLNGWYITIHIADGAYASFAARPINGSGHVTITGNPATPANVTITGVGATAAEFAFVGGVYYFEGASVSCSGTPGPGDALCDIGIAGNTTSVFIGAMRFGQCISASIAVGLGALMGNWQAGCAWTIVGGASGWAPPYNGDFIFVGGAQASYNAGGGPSITIANAVNFPGGFVASWSFGNCGVLYSALAGAANVSGPRYLVQANSLISSGGGGPNYYPGSVAGTAVTANGGYYV